MRGHDESCVANSDAKLSARLLLDRVVMDERQRDQSAGELDDRAAPIGSWAMNTPRLMVKRITVVSRDEIRSVGTASATIATSSVSNADI
jgi:hypothetical protein